jgi:hypothetical protein
MEKENEGFDALVKILLSQFEEYPETKEITEKGKPWLEREWDAIRVSCPDPESQLKILGSAIFKVAELEGKLPEELKPKLKKFHQFRLSQEKEVKSQFEKAEKHDNMKLGRDPKDHSQEGDYWKELRKQGYSKTQADKATAEKFTKSSDAIRMIRKRFPQLFEI